MDGESWRTVLEEMTALAERGDFPELAKAMERFLETYRISEEDAEFVVRWSTLAGWRDLRQGYYGRSRTNLLRAIARGGELAGQPFDGVYRDGGRLVARAHLLLSELFEIVYQLPLAREHADEAERLARRTSDRAVRALATIGIGRLLEASGKRSAAVHELSRAAEWAEELPPGRDQEEARCRLGELALRVGQIDEAREISRRLPESGAQANPELVARTLLLRARLLLDQQDWLGSADELFRAQIFACKLGDPEIAWQIEHRLGYCHLLTKEFSDARRRLKSAMQTIEDVWRLLPEDLQQSYLEDPRRQELRRDVDHFLGRVRDSSEAAAAVGQSSLADRETIATPPPEPTGTSSTVAPSTGSGLGMPAAIPKAERVFAGYEILQEIGSGGGGTVYKARQVTLNRVVALKVLSRVGEISEDAVTRFRREAELAAKLRHPNIVTVHDFSQEGGYYYYTMDFIEGDSLGTLIAKGAIDRRRRLILVEQVARAVHYAHTQGIIHRDLKPGNVLIDRWGSPQIMDFGLARETAQATRVTREGTALGTVYYMSPEQASGEFSRVDVRTDVYALGVILYEMLTDKLPFSSQNFMETVQQILNHDPVRPKQIDRSIHRDLETICLKAMEKEVFQRYSTAKELADDLRRFLDGDTIMARPVGPLGRSMRRARRHQTVLALSVLLVSVSVAGAWYWWKTREEQRVEWREVYRDDFDRSEPGAHWRLLEPGSAGGRVGRGTLSIRNGQLELAAFPVEAACVMLTGASCPDNVRVEYDAMLDPEAMPSDISTVLSGSSALGLMDGYYMGFGANWNSRTVLRRRMDLLLSSSVATVVPGRRYRIRAEKEGPLVRLWANGEKVLEFEDSFPLTGQGHERIGFYTWGSRIWVDNLVVWQQNLPAKISPLVLGDEHFNAGDYRKALQRYQDIQRDLPDTREAAQARFKAALCLERLGQGEEAVGMLDLLARTGSSAVPKEFILLALADAEFRRGNYSAVLGWLDRIGQDTSSETSKLALPVGLLLAKSFAHQKGHSLYAEPGKEEWSEKFCRKALELNRDDRFEKNLTLWLLGMLALQREDLSTARTLAEQAESHGRYEGSIHLFLAIAQKLYERSDREGARKILEHCSTSYGHIRSMMSDVALQMAVIVLEEEGPEAAFALLEPFVAGTPHSGEPAALSLRGGHTGTGLDRLFAWAGEFLRLSGWHEEAKEIWERGAAHLEPILGGQASRLDLLLAEGPEPVLAGQGLTGPEMDYLVAVRRFLEADAAGARLLWERCARQKASLGDPSPVAARIVLEKLLK